MRLLVHRFVDASVESSMFSAAVEVPTLVQFLDTTVPELASVVDWKTQCSTFKNNVRLAALEQLEESELCVFVPFGLFQAKCRQKEPLMVDISAGQHTAFGVDFAPTVTSSRGRKLAYYLPFRKTMITLVELGRLQGPDPAPLHIMPLTPLLRQDFPMRSCGISTSRPRRRRSGMPLAMLSLPM